MSFFSLAVSSILPYFFLSPSNRESESESLINSLTFDVYPGKRCVIAGASGSGKTTLLNLLVGELPPRSGTILIDGQPPAQFLNEYSEVAAFAGPDPLLFEGSVRENLLYGTKRKVSDQEILDVLSELDLTSWIKSSGGDLDCYLGFDGANTSSGEAQRLSIARALLRRPRLLILDEVTANLDVVSEAAVFECLDRLNGEVTIVLVTHNKTFIDDQIDVISLGSK